MKKFIPFLLTLLAGVLLRLPVVAQSYPVQATVQLTPPYSLYLADYAAPGSNRIMANVLLRDLSRQDLQTRLRLTIEGVGISIATRPDFRPQPLYLQGGLPLMLDAVDLAPYFDPQNFVFQGVSRQEVQKGGTLPEGLYRICIQVLDYNLGAEVSNQACGTAWLILNDPPIINLPKQGEKLRAQDPQNILFQWTPRHTGSPNSAFNTEYDFQLVELWPDNRDPNQAILSTPPIYETTTFSTNLVYGPAETPLEPGRRYAFRVRARAMTGIEGVDLFKNSGYSEVYSFTYGDACTAPMMVAATALSSSRIEVRWDSQPFHTEFIVRYRKKSGKPTVWQEKRTYLNDLVVDGLLPQTEYEFQVVGICGSLNGVPSETVSMATSEAPLVSFTCGAGPGAFDLGNQAPLEELNRGDVFRAGDVEVTALEVKGGNGTFSGAGLAEMPWLRNVKLRVEFSGIFLNTDHQLLRGSVKSVFNPDSKMIVNLDGMDDLFKGKRESEEGEGSIDIETDEEIVFEGVIDSVYMDEKGEIIIIDTEGERTVYEQPVDSVTGERQAVSIVDGGGNGYVVDGEGKVSKRGSGLENTPDRATEADSVLIVQKELIKEVLEYYKEEVNVWLDSNEKGPLEEALVRRLMVLPDCLPKDEEGLKAALTRIEEYREDIEKLLNLIKEDVANKARIEELTAKLTGKQPPYVEGLSKAEWDELLEMICPYLVVEEERPKLVTIEPITDDQFAAGIDNDKLKITYSIRVTEKHPLQYAKLEVYKNNGTLAYVNSETIEIGEEKTFEWNGQVNHNVQEGGKVYIRSDESPFTIKIFASTVRDFTDSFMAEYQGNVNPMVDEFMDNYEIAKYIEASTNIGKFEYYQQLRDLMHIEIFRGQDENFQLKYSNGLDYLGAKVKERTFIGRKVMVHDNYWEYLQAIENNLSNEYVNHPDYTMGGFSIRLQRGSNSAVSNHAYGMALDVNWQRNPYLSKDQLYFLQLLTDFKLFQNPSSPEDLKSAHDKLIAFGYQQADIISMKNGFEYLNQSSLNTENFEALLKEVLGSYRSVVSDFTQLVDRNNNLRNEVHFFSYRTPQEVGEVERQLFEELPSEADALLEKIKSIKSTEEINQFYNLYKEGYQKAFLLNKHLTDENKLLLATLDRLKNLFGFEEAIASLKEACKRPVDSDYTYWVTNMDIIRPQQVQEASTYQRVSAFIESRKADYKVIFGKSSSYLGVIDVLSSSSSITLAQNGFMLMSAEFAREFIDAGNGTIIDWGGSWKGLKDFMHFEYVEKNKFGDKN